MTTENPIIARECRFAYHFPNTKKLDLPDIHMVKEQIHLQDGTIRPNLRFIRDYKRPFYIAQKGKRNYQQKKEWCPIEDTVKVMTTQSDLRDNVARALDKMWSKDHIKKLSSSPYLYGSDITSTALIKNDYRVKWPEINTPWTVSTLDAETDVVNMTQEIIMLTVTFKASDHLEVFTVIQRPFVAGLANVESQIQSKMEEYLGDYVKKLNIQSSELIVDTEIDVVRKAFEKLHEWKPDFCAIWNIDFDVQRVMDACERANVHPKDIICDPSVPAELRYFKYNQGIKKKVTASGKETPINPANQWHTVSCPTSFVFIDAMCSFRQIRLAKQEEATYALDAILNKMLGIRKLKFDVADSYIGLKWHQFMQMNYKLEYIIYNRFDSISMIELDNKTLDLQVTLPTYAGTTDFAKFNSQPKKIADQMYFFLLEEGLIQGTVGQIEDKPEEEQEADNGDDDNEESVGNAKREPVVLSLKDWIITLPAHLVVDNGLCCSEEDPKLHSNGRAYVYDADAVSSYPSDISALNVSKETTKKEIIDIPGIPETVFRMQNINLLSGPTNALEYCTTMFNFPKPEEVLASYLAQKYMQ